MKVLLTGSTGFIGSHLLASLRAQGTPVEVLQRGDGQSQIDAKISSFRPDVVIHLATLFEAEHKTESIPAMIASNITFGTQIVDSMVRYGVNNLIHAGTLWQYFNDERGVGSCLYAATKNAFEDILKFYVSANSSLKVIHLMISDSYGPNDHRPKLLPKLLQIAGTDQKLMMSPGLQKIDWTYISDLISAFETAAKRLVMGQETEKIAHYSISTGIAISLQETVLLCEQVTGKKINIEFGAKPYRAREVMKPSRIDKTLPGWKAKVGLLEGLKECVK
jgi:nucleoside-diphosphate-sugar epimerase